VKVVLGADTLSLGRAQHDGNRLSEGTPVTESVIPVVHIYFPVEWLEGATPYADDCATAHWTVVRRNLVNAWIVIVPVDEVLEGILLSIHGHRKRHASTYYIRPGSSAPNVVFVDKVSFGTTRTEIAPEIVTEVKEVLAPDLYYGVSIFWSVPRINTLNHNLLIVSVWRARVDVIKSAGERYRK